VIVEYVGQDGFDHQEEYHDGLITFLEERGAQYITVIDDNECVIYEDGGWLYFVTALYEILPRGFGGPEEGGWYYDRGLLNRNLLITQDKGHAYRMAYRANKLLLWLQRHKPHPSSVLYRGGRHQAEVWVYPAPSYYPLTIPKYE
jgi:hypothetical protein